MPIAFIKKHSILISVSLAHFVDLFYFGIVLPIQKPILNQFAPSIVDDSNASNQHSFYSYWQLAVFASYALGYLISTPFYGLISDHPKCRCLGSYHRKIPYIFSSVSLVISLVLGLIGRGGVATLIISRITQGISAAGTSVIGLALLSDSYEQEELGWSVSITMVLHAIGFSLGPLIGGLFEQLKGYRLPFIFCFILTILDFILRILLVKNENNSSKESFEEKEWKMEKGMERIKMENGERDGKNGNKYLMDPSLISSSLQSLKLSMDSSNISFRRILRESEVWMIASATLIGASTFGVIEGLLADYLMTSFNVNNLQASFGLASFIIPSSMAGLVIGYLSRPKDRYWIISLGLIVHGLVLCWPFMLEGNLWIFLPSAIIYGATHAMITQPPISELSGLIDRLSLLESKRKEFKMEKMENSFLLNIDSIESKEESFSPILDKNQLEQEIKQEMKSSNENNHSNIEIMEKIHNNDHVDGNDKVDHGNSDEIDGGNSNGIVRGKKIHDSPNNSIISNQIIMSNDNENNHNRKCQSYARIYSIMNIVESLGMIIGPVFAELTRGGRGKYLLAMIILASTSFFYGIIYFFIFKFKLLEKRKILELKENSNDDEIKKEKEMNKVKGEMTEIIEGNGNGNLNGENGKSPLLISLLS